MAIVTPIWEESLKPTAEAFIRRSILATAELPHWYVAPETLDTSWYERFSPASRVARFPDAFFRSSQTYSRLLISPRFYAAFERYEFITICQTDAVLIDNPASAPMDNLDYLGAPWNPPLRSLKIGKRLYVTSSFGHDNESRLIQRLGRDIHVGNGGLSIRRIDPHKQVANRLTRKISSSSLEAINEDAVLCSVGPSLGLRIAGQALAEQIFLESESRHLTDIPPVYGFHGLERWNPGLARLLSET